VMLGVLLFHEQSEVEAGRAATYADDFHFDSGTQKRACPLNWQVCRQDRSRRIFLFSSKAFYRPQYRPASIFSTDACSHLPIFTASRVPVTFGGTSPRPKRQRYPPA